MRSQPKRFESIIKSGAFKSSSLANIWGFQLRLAQDFLSRAMMHENIFENREQHVSALAFAFQVLSENSQFNFGEAKTAGEKKLLFDLDFDFHITLFKLTHLPDDLFVEAIKLALSCAKRPDVVKAMIMAKLSVYNVEKMQLVKDSII